MRAARGPFGIGQHRLRHEHERPLGDDAAARGRLGRGDVFEPAAEVHDAGPLAVGAVQGTGPESR